MDAYKDIFLSESAEFVQAITDGLLSLESNPEDLEPVEVIFRGAHSLKGMAAAMGYDRTSDLTHKMESLMERVRQREMPPNSPLIDLMLEAVDLVRALIEDESEGGSSVDPSDLAARVEAMASGAAPKEGSRETTASRADRGEEPGGEAAGDSSASGADGSAAMERSVRVVVGLEEGCVLKAVRAYMVMKRLSHIGQVIDTVPSTREIEDEQFDREFTVVVQTSASAKSVEEACMGVSEVEAAAATVLEAEQKPQDAEDQPHVDAAAPTAAPRTRTQIPKLSETQTVRVAIGHLDTLVNLVGELVILRSRLERIAADVDNRELNDALEDMHRVAAELQHEVMHTRMVPVSNIFNRFPRMVRDLSHDLGKEIDFQMEGLEIELDRTVLDEIGDPIVHLLRNSIDHGIESAEDRERAGKPARGKVTLSAARERDLVSITVSDDGRGIDCGRVWEKAHEQGLTSADRDQYSDEQVLMLTCVPGFSTAEEATKVSGRGVGMDVVKGKIEHLGGSLQIRSEPGVGSWFTLTLPLTLAIIQALMIESDGQMFALPLSAVDEVLSAHDMKIDTVDGAPVVIHRDGEVISVYALDYLLGIEGQNRAPSGDEPVVIVETMNSRRALLVGALEGRREIVIKPLSSMFNQVSGVGGATVLGDGRVAMIIDPRTIFPGREEGA